jgi:hypothetical protein
MLHREINVMDLERIQLIYFVINRSLEITDSGKLMKQRVPLGSKLNDAFDVLRPMFRRELGFDQLTSFRNRIFVLRSKSGDGETFFRGEFMPGEGSSTLTFYGVSWMPTESDLREIEEGGQLIR